MLPGDRMLPGTANNSLPCSAANWAVISAPLRSPASTTMMPRLSPLMMRLRGGKLLASGRVPSAYSLISAPCWTMDNARPRFCGG